MSDTSIGYLIAIAALTACGWLVRAIVEDGRETAAYKQAFYAACTKDRPRYDCDIQWATYESAHNAEMAAAIAAGSAAGAAAGRK